MCGVPVAEQRARHGAAPAQARTAEQAIKILLIQFVKNLFQVKMIASGLADPFAAAHAADGVNPVANVPPVQELPIARLIALRNGFAVELGEQDEGQRFQHRGRSGFQQVRQAHFDSPLPNSDDVVDIGIRTEAHFKLRQRRARPDGTEGFRKDLLAGVGQGKLRR